MAKRRKTEHFVVDGSNIATEGRSSPSLEQLNEAVLAFIDERPDALITVVVDATFGHRIDKKEAKAFDEAVANNELVAPPAGAIGRGDAFVLSIADKAGAGVLSNDSFQEFHGEYEWLFEEGRLIGGKPVPHVGWVFVPRTPVRGAKSRQAVRAAKQASRTDAKERAQRRVKPKASTTVGPVDDAPSPTEAPEPPSAPASKEVVNELMPFLDFVEHHPVGTSCTGVVESYSSHGAYARVGEVLVYIPLRLMDQPPPRSARSAMKLGEAVTVVVAGFVPDRRSIDGALPHVAAGMDLRPGEAVAAESRRAARRTTAKKAASDAAAPAKKAAAKKRAAPRARKTAAKKAAATATAKQAAATKTPPSKAAAAKKTPAKKAAAKKTPAKTPAAKKTPAARKTPAKKTPAKKTAAAKKTPAKRSPAKRTATPKATS